jgi:hypothetical protein
MPKLHCSLFSSIFRAFALISRTSACVIALDGFRWACSISAVDE